MTGAIIYGADLVLDRYIFSRSKTETLNLGRWLYFSSQYCFETVETEGQKSLKLKKGKDGAVDLHLSTQLAFFPIQKIALYNQSGELVYKSVFTDNKPTSFTASQLATILAGNTLSKLMGNPDDVDGERLQMQFAVYDSFKAPLGVYELEIEYDSYRELHNLLLRAISICAAAVIFSCLLIFYTIWGRKLLRHIDDSRLKKALNSSSLHLVCSVCGRMEIEEGSWVEVEDIGRYEMLRTSHTVCPDCLGKDY